MTLSSKSACSFTLLSFVMLSVYCARHIVGTTGSHVNGRRHWSKDCVATFVFFPPSKLCSMASLNMLAELCQAQVALLMKASADGQDGDAQGSRRLSLSTSPGRAAPNPRSEALDSDFTRHLVPDEECVVAPGPRRHVFASRPNQSSRGRSSTRSFERSRTPLRRHPGSHWRRDADSAAVSKSQRRLESEKRGRYGRESQRDRTPLRRHPGSHWRRDLDAAAVNKSQRRLEPEPHGRYGRRSQCASASQHRRECESEQRRGRRGGLANKSERQRQHRGAQQRQRRQRQRAEKAMNKNHGDVGAAGETVVAPTVFVVEGASESPSASVRRTGLTSDSDGEQEGTLHR